MSVRIQIITDMLVYTDEEIDVKSLVKGTMRKGIKDLNEDPNSDYVWFSCYVPEPRERDLVHAPHFNPQELDLSSIEFSNYELCSGWLKSGPYYVIPAKGPRVFTGEEMEKCRYYKGCFSIRLVE